MNFCVLMGSPRLHGNTAALCAPFLQELSAQGAAYTYFELYQQNIQPCRGCYACQQVSGEYGCPQKDDMTQILAPAICRADCIVLATPIYAWFCTAPMKAVLDRHYGFNKYYGSAEGSLWAGKHVALLLTHGYEQDDAAAPLETGVRRLCEHSLLLYDGMYSVRDEDADAFTTPEAVAGAQAFARKLCAQSPDLSR
ncbi:MAG: flavodoxin family protein [Eubacteriales bacterium]|nr:flavodoxin family protein [Eubacteriales bacterium]